MDIKLEIEKPNDRLEENCSELFCWSWFPREVDILDYGMNNIHEFVSARLWYSQDPFRLERDIKRRDLISPYPFIFALKSSEDISILMSHVPKTDIGIKVSKMV